MAGAFKLTTKGLDTWRRSIARTPPALKRALSNNLRKAARLVQADMKNSFVDGLTDKRTRKREDKGKRLGKFSGKGRNSIKIKQRVKSRRSFRAEIGPTGKPRFYLALHDSGSGKFPRRPLITPTVGRTKKKVREIIGRSVKAIG